MPCTCRCLRRSEEGIGIPGAGIQEALSCFMWVLGNEKESKLSQLSATKYCTSVPPFP